MLNKLLAFQRQYAMLRRGDRVVCAVSGGADSVALLFALYLLSEKLGIIVEAAHFNHHLRGEESDRDEAFVRSLCERYDITLHVADAYVKPGKKGLEAAARDARYGFLRTLPGKIATAHTADDNAETLLMHLIRGTGLKGLGGIAPISGSLIRPMLAVTREEVLAFLTEYNLSWVTDSSNETDLFLRNRLRHHVIPLLKQENPCLVQNLSATALRLRDDEDALSAQIPKQLPDIVQLRRMHPAYRSRVLTSFLTSCGLREPESQHIAAAEKLVFSSKPSAFANLPNGIVIQRNYDRLELCRPRTSLRKQALSCPGSVELQDPPVRVTVRPADQPYSQKDRFTVCVCGPLYLRSRQPGDEMRLPGGTKDLKKLYIDRKIPAGNRMSIPVLADDTGVVGVYGIGPNLDRLSCELPCVEVCFEEIK